MAGLVALVLLAGVSGCGGKSDEESAKEVVSASTRSGAAFCDLSTDRLLAREYGSHEACRKDEENDPKVVLKISRVEVEGGRATVSAAEKAEGRSTYTLQRQGGDWRIDRVEQR